jgi:hypothetical protein
LISVTNGQVKFHRQSEQIKQMDKLGFVKLKRRNKWVRPQRSDSDLSILQMWIVMCALGTIIELRNAESKQLLIRGYGVSHTIVFRIHRSFLGGGGGFAVSKE